MHMQNLVSFAGAIYRKVVIQIEEKVRVHPIIDSPSPLRLVLRYQLARVLCDEFILLYLLVGESTPTVYSGLADKQFPSFPASEHSVFTHCYLLFCPTR